jgi:hypothetical protein
MIDLRGERGAVRVHAAREIREAREVTGIVGDRRHATVVRTHG